MSAFRRTGSRRALLAFCLSCLTGMVHAQVPAQPPIRILVGAPAGGTTGTMPCTLAQSPGVTSASRLPALPDVPAIAETLPGYESSAWFGLFGPAHMPAELTRRLSEATRAAVQSPEVRRRIEHEGATPVGNSPEAFAKFVESEIHRWGAVVRYAGAKPE